MLGNVGKDCLIFAGKRTAFAARTASGPPGGDPVHTILLACNPEALARSELSRGLSCHMVCRALIVRHVSATGSPRCSDVSLARLFEENFGRRFTSAAFNRISSYKTAAHWHWLRHGCISNFLSSRSARISSKSISKSEGTGRRGRGRSWYTSKLLC